jgi:DNA anti-recombination protein RmuC
MNYYKAVSETGKLIQSLHRLNQDMEWVACRGAGPLEDEDPEVHERIQQQLQGWMNISNYFLDFINDIFEERDDFVEELERAKESLLSEHEVKTKKIENLKRRIELKNKKIRELKAAVSNKADLGEGPIISPIEDSPKN